jgi:hypothetical protein
MSVYRTFDEGPTSELSVQRLVIRRKAEDARPARGAPSSAAFVHLRRSHPVDDPLPVTFKWIACLPREVQPHALMRQFPRLANALAMDWRETHAFRARLYDLLMDKRGNRSGFPNEVLAELLALRKWVEDRCYPGRG